MNENKIKDLVKHLERNNGFAKWEAIQALSIIKRLKAEVERGRDFEALYKNLKEEHLETIKAIKFTKSEAYREFAERLKEQTFFMQDNEGFECEVVFASDINGTLTELTERKEDEGK